MSAQRVADARFPARQPERGDRASLSTLARPALRDRLQTQTFDLLVIGGGITGAGIARDAALRGLTTALVEMQDFASGTSGNSARLIHGGVRYVEMLQFDVVREACAERRVLDTIAPHLVTPLPFVILMSSGWRSRLKYWLGLHAYDFVSGYTNVQRSGHLDAAGLARAEPNLRPRNARGPARRGARYWERATDDARLTLTTVLSAVRAGALALNHAQVVGLLKHGSQVTGAAVRDQLSGASLEVRATHVVNATGPWNDTVRGLDEPAPEPSVRPNRGVHIVVPRAKLPVQGAVDFMASGRKRMMYAVPWRGTTIVGTTDMDYAGDLSAVCATRDEVAWILESINGAFDGVNAGSDDVISTFAGLRPLVRGQMKSAYRATREHQVTTASSGLISIAGGKLTTHRGMAQDVVDLVSARLGRGGPCRTAALPLDEGVGAPDAMPALLDQARVAAQSVPDTALTYLVHAYGSRSLNVLGLAAADPALRLPIVAGLPYLWAEVDYAVEHELGATLSDLLIRRMRLMHEAPGQGLAEAPAVAARLAALLGWSPAETERQLAAYRAQVALTRRYASEPPVADSAPPSTATP